MCGKEDRDACIDYFLFLVSFSSSFTGLQDTACSVCAHPELLQKYPVNSLYLNVNMDLLI